MRRLILSSVLAGTLLASMAGTALAGSDNHSTPGTPGEANCVGQTMAFIAQSGPALGVDAHGIGGIAHAADVSVKDLKAAAQAYCAGE
jgi:hypothetical protein